MTSAKMVFLGYHDIDRAAYQDHAGAALPAYLTNINGGHQGLGGAQN